MRIKRADLDAIIDAGASGQLPDPPREGPTAQDFWLGAVAVGEAVLAPDTGAGG